MAGVAEASRSNGDASLHHHSESMKSIDDEKGSKRGTAPFTWIVILALSLFAVVYAYVIFDANRDRLAWKKQPSWRPEAPQREQGITSRTLRTRHQAGDVTTSCNNSRRCKPGAQCIRGICVRRPTTPETTGAATAPGEQESTNPDTARDKREPADAGSTSGELYLTYRETTGKHRKLKVGKTTNSKREITYSDNSDERNLADIESSSEELDMKDDESGYRELTVGKTTSAEWVPAYSENSDELEPTDGATTSVQSKPFDGKITSDEREPAGGKASNAEWESTDGETADEEVREEHSLVSRIAVNADADALAVRSEPPDDDEKPFTRRPVQISAKATMGLGGRSTLKTTTTVALDTEYR
ncbi:uncharacterized protein LOC144103504 [Amblyomma americanum]